jgi:hypothetical protein
MKMICVLFFTFLFAQVSLALESVGTNIHEQYQSPRALGMGGAFVAVANDYSALFYNPAGLDRIDENDLNMNLDFAGTPAISDLLKNINDIRLVLMQLNNLRWRRF